MKLIVGLGNPGTNYASHRHNAGFIVAGAIAEAHGFGGWKGKFHAAVADGSLGGVKCLMVLPQTYMNKSGISVGEAASFYKVAPQDVLVLHDELDLPLGKMKTKIGGGHAGHNGLKDVDRVLGPEYWRLRLGIGHPGNRAMVSDYVLSNFGADEWPAVEAMAKKTVALVSLWATGDATWQKQIHTEE